MEKLQGAAADPLLKPCEDFVFSCEGFVVDSTREKPIYIVGGISKFIHRTDVIVNLIKNRISVRIAGRYHAIQECDAVVLCSEDRLG